MTRFVRHDARLHARAGEREVATQSIALCRTNSSGQRSVFSTTPRSSSTTAFCVDAPLISPVARSASTSCTKPNVRAGASSRANDSGVTA